MGPVKTVLAAALAVLGLAIPASAATPFRVGIAAPTVNMLPLWIGQAEGLFAQRGLTVEIVNTDGGSRGLAEVGAERLQAMAVGLSAVMDANGRGGDYRIVASAANTMSFRFFGARGVTAESLRGKRVGISTAGSESDSAAGMALKALGLARQDVEIVEAGGTLRRLEALQTGALAATALNEPADTAAARANLPLLADLKADLPWIFTGIVVDRAYLAANRETVKAFLSAYIEAIHLALFDGARSKAVLAAEFRDFAPEIVDVTYEDFRARVPRDAAPSRAGAQTMLRELPALGSSAGSTRVEDFVDDSVIEDLRREGFIAATAMKYRTE